MGHISVVHGWIQCRRGFNAEKALEEFAFDPVYPFSNIFWAHSPARYSFPLVVFGGSYKQLEDDWNEWLWRFSQLLATLDAIEAKVGLDGVYGVFEYRLQPLAVIESRFDPFNSTLIGEPWVIVEAPEQDIFLNDEFQRPNIPVTKRHSK